MTETKFTPGPWEVYDQTEEHEACWAVGMGSYIEDPNYHLAADFWLCESSDKKAEANAHLIAAAPDLYESLETIVEAGGIGPEDMFHDARDALAKARGES